MPRPKPPEKLYEASHRFTDRQLSKIRRNGGPTWLRNLVDTAPDVPVNNNSQINCGQSQPNIERYPQPYRVGM